MSSPTLLEPGAPIAGKYRVVACLGSGAMGVVYKARHDLITTHTVAVKVLQPEVAGDPELVARFRQEAMALAALSSPHIIRLLDFGYTDDDIPYLVMEFSDGETLRQRLQREGALCEASALRCALHIADALVEAHSEGVVHRDLKPDNVFCVPPSGDPDAAPDQHEAKVLDFGIAKIVGDARLDPITRTRAGQVLCTPEYGAPEVFYGAPERVSDIYSLGIMMIEMLSGRVPYDGPTTTAIAAKHVEETPVPLPEISHAGLREVIKGCLAKNPRERIPSAVALRDALLEIADAGPLKRRPTAVTMDLPVVAARTRDSVVDLAELPRPTKKGPIPTRKPRDSRAIAALQAFRSAHDTAQGRPRQIVPVGARTQSRQPSWDHLAEHPATPEAYRERFDFLRPRDLDAAFLALGSLVALNAATPYEQDIYRQLRETLPRMAERPIGARELRALEPSMNVHVREVFALLGACAMDDVALIDPSTAEPPPSTSRLGTHEQWAMLPYFQQVAKRIGVTAPDFYVASGIEGIRLLNMAPPTALIPVKMWQTPPSRSWLYTAGITVGGMIAPYHIAAIAPDARFVEQWFTAAALAATQLRGTIETTGDVRARALARQPDEVLTSLRRSVTALLQGNEVVDIARWLAEVETSLDRIGLLFSGDITSVAKRMREQHRMSHLTYEDRLADLILFNASPTHVDLRRRMGMRVRD